jgi:Cu/Ag efflux protein CusF
MSKTKQIALATLTLCALALPALGSTANPVARPFQGKATVTWTVNMLTGSATGYETGVATHLGLYLNESSAIYSIDPATFGIVSATGVVTTADGAQAFWKMTPDQPGVVQVTGGTRRLAGLTGSLATVSMEEPIISVDYPTMTMTITLTYKAAGTLIY